MTCPSAADPTVPCRFNGCCHESRKQLAHQWECCGMACDFYVSLLLGPKMQNTPTEDTEQPF